MVQGNTKYSTWRWCQSRRGTKACASGCPCNCPIHGKFCAITSFLFTHGSQFKITVLINLFIFNTYLYSDFYFAGYVPPGAYSYLIMLHFVNYLFFCLLGLDYSCYKRFLIRPFGGIAHCAILEVEEGGDGQTWRMIRIRQSKHFRAQINR